MCGWGEDKWRKNSEEKLIYEGENGFERYYIINGMFCNNSVVIIHYVWELEGTLFRHDSVYDTPTYS